MSELQLLSLPAHPTSSSSSSSLGSALLSPHPSHSCSARQGCSTSLALTPIKVPKARHVALPKTLPKFQCGMQSGGTSPLCLAHPESAVYIYIFAHIPSPSFLFSLCYFFLSLCISFSVSLPSCFVRTNIAQSLIPICRL